MTELKMKTIFNFMEAEKYILAPRKVKLRLLKWTIFTGFSALFVLLATFLLLKFDHLLLQFGKIAIASD